MAATNSPAPTPVHPVFDKELRILLRAGQQLISINGCNEIYRARLCIQQVAATMPKEPWTVFTWNPSRGFTWSNVDQNRQMRKIPFVDKGEETRYRDDPIAALQIIPSMPPGLPGLSRAVFVFCNFHLHLEQHPVIRDALQTMVDEGKFTSSLEGNAFKRPVILLHQAASLHAEIRDYAMPVIFPPANENDMADAIIYVGNSVLGGKQACPEPLRDKMAGSMLGLGRQQGEDTTSVCLVAVGGWDEEKLLTAIEDAKGKRIKQEGYLTYVPHADTPALNNIGGWEEAEGFVRRQCFAYTPIGRKMELPVPRGALLLGLPGTGKSMFAKMITRIIREVTGMMVPTYKLNYDALFAGIVGETEANVRRLMEILRAQRRYILVVDEMEKFLGSQGGEHDGGVSRKASAKFLDWLSERVLGVDDEQDLGYIVGTMNSLAGLEPEFLRRFDVTFFVDLPDHEVRLDILKIHLRLQKADMESIRTTAGNKLGKEDWEELNSGMEDFSGSDVLQAVTNARLIAALINVASLAGIAVPRTTDEFRQLAALIDKRPGGIAAIHPDLARPTFEQLFEAIDITSRSIMARVHAERIKEIRDWCRDRALPVHKPKPIVSATTSTRRGGRSIDTN